jgi:futalosine hydrolase
LHKVTAIMKILLVSATFIEVEGVYKTLETSKCLEKNYFRGFVGEKLIDILITGVGAANTAECLTRRLQVSHYDIVLNIGICGGFGKTKEIGTVVNIVSETWGDLGVEDHDDFMDLFDLRILKEDESPFSGNELKNPGNIYSQHIAHLPQVKGITVNKAHGNKTSIEKCINKYSPDVESMEGTAIFSICISGGINFQCIRSISNFVEPRNRSAWDVEEALKNLTIELNRFISVISK